MLVNNRNRNNKQHETNKPQRRKRVVVDKNTEIIVTNNTPHRLIVDNPRMQSSLDLESHGDSDYLTVADLRVIMNTNKRILEGFDLILTDVADGSYELEDVIVYLGLERAYNDYFSLSPNWKRGQVSESDIKDFILKSNPQRFKEVMNNVDDKLRKTIIQTAIVLFKLNEFGDYNKMQVIRDYTNDDIFADAEETEIDENVTLI